MDLWNEKITRENFTDFYQSTVEMVYSSVYGITKETTRAEQAIIKSYLDTYQQRNVIKGEDVLYTFGDILLKNANDIVEKYPLPENVNFATRTLDEYTRNFMLEKIIAKIDSAGYKVAEFISSDSKRGKSAKSWQKISDLFPITPLLIIQLVLLTLVIWAVSTAAITLPYRDEPLVDEEKIFEEAPLQEKYVTVIPYYPLGVKYPNVVVSEDEGGDESIISEATEQQVLAPVIAETEPSATRG
ncbi:MAG TPA: hypothetical protein DCW41_06310 [Clostridiales bacterium]|nr:hypothetical protein [Clostridiales bacterium]